ncbi:MAG: ABC transporter ATP-binding protein [Candidatus Eisenbacteria bacterium]|nr:ABC transporter ATP-binding protein [Candidatus Eisenbacteria bacterium]
MIRVEGVAHAYRADRPVLEGVTFKISGGEKVVLLGCNGSGKTTLLRILNGLLFPDAGHYFFRGKKVDRRTLADAEFHRDFRRRVAFLFQNPDAMIFNPTVRDEIAFGPRRLGLGGADDRAETWARNLGIAPLLDRPPFQLSTGEKQKVCLAALLALEPEVLLLDEPTGSLDPRTTGWLVDFLQDLSVTTVTTTHNLSLGAELGERALVLSEKHTLLYDGPIEGILGDERKLLEANLVHIHRHRHAGVEHRHFHAHDWE